MPKKVTWWNLDIGREYYIETNDELCRKYKLVFVGLYGPRHFHDYGSSEYAWFVKKGIHYQFERDDNFYDVEEIKEKAQKARQQMESRTLNKILKRVVNEEFEWYACNT
jgi:hypothetical protein